MVFSLYGNYNLLLKELESSQASNERLNLKLFLEKKPQLTEQITQKVQRVCEKLVDKGLIRHTIVQAVLCDYFQ